MAVLIVLAGAVLNQATDVIGALERRFYDYASTRSSRLPSNRIAIIAIDDPSIAAIGRWPWPRDVHARLIDQLAAAKAKTIVYTTFFFEPQTDRGMVFIRRIKEVLGPVPEGQGGPAEQLAKVVAEAERTLDSDAQLTASMVKAGNVLVPSVFELGRPLDGPDSQLPPYVARNTLPQTHGFSVPATRGHYPIGSIGAAAAGSGHLNQLNDVDGVVREEPLLVDYYGKAVPSMALLAAAHSLNLGASDIKINAGESVQLGNLLLKTDAAARMLPQFYKGSDGRPPFPADSFHDVVTGKVPASKYADKIVLVGATAAGVSSSFATPGYPSLSPAEMLAHSTSSILGEHFIVQPSWATWGALAAFLLVAAYLVALLPRLSAGMGAAITALAFTVLLASEFLLLTSASLWLKLMFPAVLLVIGHLALAAKRLLVTDAGELKSGDESAETHRMMGLALQGQGQLDAAFDRFGRVPMDDAVMENMYNLALDFERKRQFNKAQAVYEHMAGFNSKFKDLESKLSRARNLSETALPGGGGPRSGAPVLLDVGAVEKPMLGRYQVERELGKGAMGVVYQGRDPKIGRVVAIKTMALSKEFEGEQLEDARERFFREAETAGRLQHQNIVTIFDAGEEHDLAYIAMEFLRGKDLADFCMHGHLLPVPKVLSIAARVAEALAYAHRQNVVHRDIKPANIMYELGSDTVKVTDFGIARITDSSKTKTGLVLGTPSFMSPEQIAGKKVDGRSDLYSLGVMLFQMLSGVLPFRGESMAELMHKIASEEAPDIRIVRKEIPERLANVVALALSKRVETRYQDGEQLAGDLRFVLAELAGAPAVPSAAVPRVAGMRLDSTVAAVASAKTVAFQAPGKTMAARDSDKTVVMAAARPMPAFEAPPSRAAVPAPGYDPTGQTAGGIDAFAKTNVIRKPAVPGPRAAGTDKTDLEA